MIIIVIGTSSAFEYFSLHVSHGTWTTGKTGVVLALSQGIGIADLIYKIAICGTFCEWMTTTGDTHRLHWIL